MNRGSILMIFHLHGTEYHVELGRCMICNKQKPVVDINYYLHICGECLAALHSKVKEVKA